MLPSLIALCAVLAGWSLLARRMERWRLTAPMVVILAGIAVGFSTITALPVTLNTEGAEDIAEIILAILLFVDATDVRGGFFGGNPRGAMRVLFIAMPLSLAAAVGCGLWLLPGLPWPVLLIIACVVIPIDFAPAPSVVRDRRVPERVRNLLNVEAGYNDGIVSPLFIFALVLAETQSEADTPLEALGAAIPQAVKAILIGVAVGGALALAANAADRRAWMTHQSVRFVVVAAPLLAFALSSSIGGNGFVASFVCGITFNTVRHSHDIRRELELLDDIGFLLTVGMWFVFGATAVVALKSGVSIGMIVFCLLALTVVRILPVAASLLGSPMSWRERLLTGSLGPRGTTSIVFGLLAYNVLDGAEEHAVVLAMVVTVLGSVLLHGLGAPAAARAYSATEPSARDAN